jgi:hypothetical protein
MHDLRLDLHLDLHLDLQARTTIKESPRRIF